jgi:RHS repeat-associated protein
MNAMPLNTRKTSKAPGGRLGEAGFPSAGVMQRLNFDPFGRQSSTGSDAALNVGFTGHTFRAQSGLLLAPYRSFDPEIGRWLSEDPLFRSKN